MQSQLCSFVAVLDDVAGKLQRNVAEVNAIVVSKILPLQPKLGWLLLCYMLQLR